MPMAVLYSTMSQSITMNEVIFFSTFPGSRAGTAESSAVGRRQN